jgi:glyoxylase-like metal-dependent hydrolase (beta-lactamase superfamily II)
LSTGCKVSRRRRLPIANQWFVEKPLGDGLTLIREPHVTRALRCNIWHLRGCDRDLLIDTGMGIASLLAAFPGLFSRAPLVVATHAHGDHVGSLYEFSQRAAHAAAVELLSAPSAMRSLWRDDWPERVVTLLTEAGYRLNRSLISALPHDGFDLHHLPLQAAPPTRILQEGEVIDLGDRTLRVLHLPGHSPDSIGLFEESSGTLFSGDAIYDGPLLYNLPDSDLATYGDTMRRLIDLPVRIVHAGHDESFGKKKLHAIARRHLELW